MSKRDKILANWKTQPQPDATVETVEAMLSHYFAEGFTRAGGGSHQLRIAHPALFRHPHFIGGTLSIPVTNGQNVKPHYLKRIAEAIQIVEEAQNQDRQNQEQDNESEQ